MSKYTKVNYPEIACSICSNSFKPRTKKHTICSDACRKEYQAEYGIKWYEENRESELEKRKAYMRDWRKRHPGQTYMKCITQLYNGAKERAVNRGLEFSITPLDIVVPELCPIFNVPMKRPGRFAPSLDRKDSTKGYTPENIWVISKLANQMKQNATSQELRSFAEWAKTCPDFQ